MKLPYLSVIVPVYNEEGNIVPLHNEISSACKDLQTKRLVSKYEIIYVNDGSRDRTLDNLLRIKDKFLKVIDLRKNFGQTAALKAGFDSANGDYIVTLDGDMQNDPNDIYLLIKKLQEGYDVVSGWRYNRKDTSSKRFFSRLMNNLRRNIIGDNLHDYGCSLKIYRKECIKDLQLFGELHRYITAYLYIKGYRIGEVKVNHRPRVSGKTKYKFNRGLNGLFDLLFLKFWSGFSTKPLHFFGRLGIYQWIIAFILVIEQIVKAVIVNELRFGPVLALASMLIVTGLIFMMFGFLSEMISRIYLKEEQVYSVRKLY